MWKFDNMKSGKRTYNFTTPAIISGATQKNHSAELRGASIRGALRWWFRLIAASEGDVRNLESDIFGCAHPEPKASKLRVRITEDNTKSEAIGDKYKRSLYILWAMRNSFREWLKPDGTFSLDFDLVRNTERDARAVSLLKTALDAFGLFGTLGTASRKCMGSLQETKYSDMTMAQIVDLPIVHTLQKADNCEVFFSKKAFNTCDEGLSYFTEVLRGLNDKLRWHKRGANFGSRITWPFVAKVLKAKEGYFIAVCVFADLMPQKVAGDFAVLVRSLREAFNE